MAEMVKERVKTLAALSTSCTHPLTIALDSFSLALILRKEDQAEWRDKGFLPFLPHELAWVVAGKEQLRESVDLTLIFRAKAVLPPQAELNGVLLTPEHCGEPYFQHDGQPVIVVCGHAQPPAGRPPACVLTPEEVLALFEAPAGTCGILLAVRHALPGATLLRPMSDEGSRDDLVFVWRELCVIVCSHVDHAQPHDGTPSAVVGEQLPVFVTATTLEQLAPLSEREKETALSVLRVFPGATLFPA
jgi:hypothetical protein